MWSHSSSSQASSVSRPRVVGDAVIIGKATVLARRVARSGCWEVEKPHPVALSRLLTMAYGKRISSGSDMVKLLEKAFTTLPRNLREADQLISALPEPLVEAEDRVEAANRLLKDGVSPYHLEEALRGEQLGLRPAPAWAERLTLCDKGVVLGKGTVIVGLTDLPYGGTGLDLEGKEERVVTLLSVARQGWAGMEALDKLEAVSRALEKGDISVATIALAQLGQPPLDEEQLAKKLDWAARRMNSGISPRDLLKSQRIFPTDYPRWVKDKESGKTQAHDPADGQFESGEGNSGKNGKVKIALVTVYDSHIGTHSALYIEKDGRARLYDPAGGYKADVRGSNGVQYDENADIEAYKRFHESQGSKVKVDVSYVNSDDADKLIEGLDTGDEASPGGCALSVSDKLSTLHEFSEIGTHALPGSLRDRFRDIKNGNAK